MDNIVKVFKPIEDAINTSSNVVIKNDYSIYILTIVTIFVAISSYDNLPYQLKQFFGNPFFAALIAYLGAYQLTKNVQTSLMMTLSLFVIFFLIKLTIENFEIIKDTPPTFPGCLDVTKQQIIDAFGSEEKAEKEIKMWGIPNVTPITDSNAPFIANYLINKKYKITEKCSL